LDGDTAPDGLFAANAPAAHLRQILKNRPIGGDSRWNRADSESAKFPFEIKSTNF
jgi:hypothetical protein